jgi:serine/threonine protein kinase
MRQALKLMLPKAASEQYQRNLFVRETDLLGQLDHPHIVRQLFQRRGWGKRSTSSWNYCNGGTLSQQLKAAAEE